MSRYKVKNWVHQQAEDRSRIEEPHEQQEMQALQKRELELRHLLNRTEDQADLLMSQLLRYSEKLYIQHPYVDQRLAVGELRSWDTDEQGFPLQDEKGRILFRHEDYCTSDEWLAEVAKIQEAQKAYLDEVQPPLIRELQEVRDQMGQLRLRARPQPPARERVQKAGHFARAHERALAVV